MRQSCFLFVFLFLPVSYICWKFENQNLKQEHFVNQVVNFYMHVWSMSFSKLVQQPNLFSHLSAHSLCKFLIRGTLSALLTHRTVAGLQMAFPAGRPSHMAFCMEAWMCYVCMCHMMKLSGIKLSHRKHEEIHMLLKKLPILK